jgi:hypothetical protein
LLFERPSFAKACGPKLVRRLFIISAKTRSIYVIEPKLKTTKSSSQTIKYFCNNEKEIE